MTYVAHSISQSTHQLTAVGKYEYSEGKLKDGYHDNDDSVLQQKMHVTDKTGSQYVYICTDTFF